MSLQRTPPVVKEMHNPNSESDSTNASGSKVTNRRKRRRPSHEDIKEDMQLFKTEIRSMFDKIAADVAEVKEQNTTIQQTFSDIQRSNEEIKKSMNFINEKFEDMKNKIAVLEKTKNDQFAKIQTLEDKIEELDRMSCLSKLEIRNLPPTTKEFREDLVNSVLSITKTINLKLDPNNVRDIYRQTNKKTSKSVVVVDVSTPIMKTNILKAVKDYNSKNKPDTLNASCVNAKNEPKPIYVSEYLTYKTRKLFYLAREFAKREKYMFAWTANGKIYLRKKEGDLHIVIKSEAQLDSLKMGAKWCSMAKVCNHDRVPICGVSHAGDIVGFRDLCDMFDYNCIRRRNYKQTACPDDRSQLAVSRRPTTSYFDD